MLHYIAPILPVRNMERSVAFYQRLGFQHQPYEDGSSYAFLSMDGLSLHLSQFAGFETNVCSVYFYLEDVEGFFAKLRDAGVPTLEAPEDKPWGLREFSISDPDETLLRFGQLLR